MKRVIAKFCRYFKKDTEFDEVFDVVKVVGMKNILTINTTEEEIEKVILDNKKWCVRIPEQFITLQFPNSYYFEMWDEMTVGEKHEGVKELISYNSNHFKIELNGEDF